MSNSRITVKCDNEVDRTDSTQPDFKVWRGFAEDRRVKAFDAKK